MSDGKYVEGSYYFYAPNKGAPIFFAVAFLASGIFHTYQCIKYKCWRITPLFPFCCLIFFAGFGVRSYGAFHYDNLNVMIANICMIYAAPPLLELQNYHILGRILYYVPYHSPLHPGRVLSTFAIISAVVESLNGWGASYSANQSLSDAETAVGHALIKASLLIQLFVLAAFVALAATFHLRCRRAGLTRNRRLRVPLRVLYVSVGLILVRTVYRVVEYFGVAAFKRDSAVDPDDLSPVVRYEWFFYVFEASAMLADVVLFNALHPRMYLPEDYKVYLARDGETELAGPGWEDKRPFAMTVLDPFNCAGFFRKGGDEKLWERDGVEPAAAREGKAGKTGEGV